MEMTCHEPTASCVLPAQITVCEGQADQVACTYPGAAAQSVCVGGLCIATSGSECGNGVVEDNEACDGNSLGGNTCGSLGYHFGSLACGTCQLDTSGCEYNWINVTPGGFTMGAPGTEEGMGNLDGNEVQHAVTLTKSYTLLATEVTQGMFEAFMGYIPSDGAGSGCDVKSCPVQNVNWHEAAAFTNALSESSGFVPCYSCSAAIGADVRCSPSASYASPFECPGFRLPTEAEWEYAARADTTTATYNGDLSGDLLRCEQPNSILDPIAWFCGNASGVPHPVADLQANDWGLFDMLGNVSEWCHDWYQEDYETLPTADPFGPATGTYRVPRGGGFIFDAGFARAAERGGTLPDYSQVDLGFRPARSLE